MDIHQGFSMTFTRVAGDDGIYDMKLFSRLSIGGKVNTRDLIFGTLVTLDSQWADGIPADQFAVLALELASRLLTHGYAVEATETFRKDIARKVEAVLKPSVDD